MKKVNGGYIVKQFVITVIISTCWTVFRTDIDCIFCNGLLFRGGILWNTSCMGRIWKEIPENI